MERGVELLEECLSFDLAPFRVMTVVSRRILLGYPNGLLGVNFTAVVGISSFDPRRTEWGGAPSVFN